MKKIKSLIAGVGIALSCLSAGAIGVSQTQVDTNRVAFATTNFYNVPSDVNTNPATTFNATSNQIIGGNSVIDLGNSREAYFVFGGFFTNSTANASNITFQVLWTGDFANWTTNNNNQPSSRYVLTVPGSSTNWCATPYFVTNSPPGCTLRSCENSNTSVIGGLTNSVFFRVIQKKGI